jgi:endoglucanase
VGHIDEIAVVVTHLGDDGLAAVRPGSGWDPAVMAGQRVDVLARDGAVPGVVAVKQQKRKRGEGRKPVERDDLFLDVGAKDGDELRRLIRPGDNVVWHGAPLALQGNRVASRAFDNRMGCYVALESARRIAEDGGAPGDVIAVAAVQEEVGDFAGSRTVAFSTEPDLAVAIDVTHTTDVRGADPEEEGKVVLGGGPTISRGPSIHEDVFELLYETAEAEGIPLVVEVSPTGSTSTDADAIYLSRAGVPTGVVSVPLRYMHSPIEMLDLDDLERAVQLVVAFARRLEPGMTFTG